MNHLIIEKVGYFGLALLVGIVCWGRIDALSARMNKDESVSSDGFSSVNERVSVIESRLSNVITSTNSTVPSKLTLQLEKQVQVSKNDIEWVKTVLQELYNNETK